MAAEELVDALSAGIMMVLIADALMSVWGLCWD